jgi:uracil-DNA glycosylase
VNGLSFCFSEKGADGESRVNHDCPPIEIVELDARIRECRRCELEGHIPEARPVVMDAGRVGEIVLIGQAPGIIEHDIGVPFGGRAGRELFRWFASIGIEETSFRNRIYMSAVTRCFPGKNPAGGGDRRPSRREQELCRDWFDAVIETLKPTAFLLVGTLAIERYLPGRRLEETIGKRFEQGGRTLVPLPHPSGASRWLNDPSHRELLAEALRHVRDVWHEDHRGGF